MDIADLPPSTRCGYLPPSVILTTAGFQVVPVTLTPCFFSVATAAFARSARYQPVGFFVISLPCVATTTVRAAEAGFMIPTPSRDGQIRRLISFICHVW